MPTPIPAQAGTIVDVLYRRAIATPERMAFSFASDGRRAASSITYAALAQRASQIASQLHDAAAPDARVLLLYPSGLEYVCALFGCLAAGVVAVPAYPAQAHHGRERLEEIVKDCGAAIALHTGRKNVRRAARDDQAHDWLRTLRWIATDSSAATAAAAARPDDAASHTNGHGPLIEPRASADTLALIQYTSGSTGAPRGVMLTHGNLTHNLAEIAVRFDHSEDSRGVIWLPPYHDMGLIGGILEPVFCGFPCLLMSPSAFLVRPLAWLEAIDSFRGTTSGGPNFAFDLAVRRTTPEQRAQLDLRSWRVAFNGAEPLRRETIDRFSEAFAGAGFNRRAFYPCYGLAEATLMVSGGHVDAAPVFDRCDGAALEQHRRVDGDAVTFVGCGQTIAGQTIRIVNPDTSRVCDAGEIGEIWVAGPSIAQGHWGHPPGGADEPFGHRLADEGDRRFLRTGDLGYLHGDELFITGRLRDLLIIRGRNYYPQHVEATVERAHAAIRPGGVAAFMIDEAGEARLVIAAEIARAHAAAGTDVISAIRRAVAEHQHLQVHAVTLIEPGALPKTSSGKVRRHRCQRQFADGGLETLAAWQARQRTAVRPGDALPDSALPGSAFPDGAAAPIVPPRGADDVRAWLIASVAELLDYPPASIETAIPLAHYGLDSLKATELTGALQRWTGLTLSSTVMWDCPTIDRLAAHVAALQSGETHAQTAADRPAAFEPIAIVGMACRFPGQARDPEALWQLLHSGRSAVTEVPPDRWDLGAFYDPTPGKIAKMSTRWGAFLDRVGEFDPYFFGITPREATAMDPQQRLLMEVAWEAIEASGRGPEELAGSATGVFVGISNSDYMKRQLRLDNYLHAIDVATGTGSAFCIAANRLSYALDLRGPSLAVDTACSSALVAVHLACASLQAGECERAVAAAVNLILAPETTIAFSRARMMSPTGECRPFDERADGYVRGEGCGAVVLKRLADARRDNDTILGVIRGSALNQDGKTNGMTAPSASAQAAVIARAIDSAGLTPDDITYVEAHGTGTSLGDPIEYDGLASVFGSRAADAPPCVLTSLKANLGHLESAAGMAGLIKVLLCLQHGEIPPARNFQRLNPRISATPALDIPTEPRPWAANGRPRVAGVSSFGFGGTNAHLVIEEPLPHRRQSEGPERPLNILALSARTPEGLATQATRYADHLDAHPHVPLGDLCHSANVGRTHFRHRAAFVATDRAELIVALRALASEGGGTANAEEARVIAPLGGLTFLFTGQGSQYAGMGRQLYETHPRFKATLDRCDAIAAPFLGTSLTRVMFTAAGTSAARLDDTAYAQPALFALEYALADLWQSWGLTPTAVAGHSLGEYVAACVAGVMDLEDALPLVIERARLMQALPAGGGMLAVLAPLPQAREAIQPFEPDVTIAAHNAPKHVVLSGPRSALDAIEHQLAARGVHAQMVTVSHAFHSPLIEPMLDAFEHRAAQVRYGPPAIPLASNLTGRWWPAGNAPDAAYWRRHMREPVRFVDNLDLLIAEGRRTFLEIGPALVLSGFGRRHAAGGQCVWLGSLHPDRADWTAIAQTVATMYERGAAIDWRQFDAPYNRTRVQAPSAVFQREFFWTQAPVLEPEAAAPPEPVPAPDGHPLLGARLRSAHLRFEAHAPAVRAAWLADHKVRGAIVFPAAAYLEMALAAARTAADNETIVELADVTFPNTWIMKPGDGTLAQTTILDRGAGGSSFEIHTIEERTVRASLRATGLVVRSGALGEAGAAPPSAGVDLEALRGRCREVVPPSEHYAALRSRGLEYGEAFQTVRALWRGDREALALVEIAGGDEAAQPYGLHPALLDGCFQTLAAALPANRVGATQDAWLPVAVDRLRLAAPIGPRAWAHARIRGAVTSLATTFQADIDLLDASGRFLAHVGGFRLQRVAAPAPQFSGDLASCLYDVHWTEAPLTRGQDRAPRDLAAGTWLIVSDGSRTPRDLAVRIRGKGRGCVVASPGASLDLSVQAATFDPGVPSHIAAVLERLATERAPLGGVVWFAPMAGAAAADEEVAPRAQQHLQRWLHGVQALLTHAGREAPRVWLITRGAQAVVRDASETTSIELSPLWGLGRVLALEHPELTLVRIDLDTTPVESEANRLMAELVDGVDDEIALRGATRRVPALVRRAVADAADQRLRIPAAQRYALDVARAGDLQSLQYRPRPHPSPAPGQVEIDVQVAALNFSDVMKVMGLYPTTGSEPVPIGAECAGVITRAGEGVTILPGTLVTGIAPFAFGPTVLTDARLVAPAPPGMTPQEAATIPIAFLTADYALSTLGRLQSGERVLIHAGAGGVGLAAIQIALQAGAEVFATAGTPEKRSFLEYAGVRHVFDSRTLHFESEIRRLTDGEGVDLVLNSLSGEAIARSLALLRPYGRFLEIGKTDIYQRSHLPLSPFRHSLSYFAIDLDRMFRDRMELVQTMLNALMTRFARGELRPLPRRVFPAEEAVAAFRYMAQRKNIGKVQITPAATASRTARSRLHAAATYLVTGGAGALGLELMDWLVSRGARHVAVVGRSAPSAETVQRLQRHVEADIRTFRADVADASALESVLGQVKAEMPPLRGVFHAAGVVDDCAIGALDQARLGKVLSPKVAGAWNLDRLTRDEALDHFVLFGSAAGVLGSPGQSNYAAANAFLDALAWRRRAEGRPALSVDWGPFASIGMAAGRTQGRLAGKGMMPLPAIEGLALLDDLLDDPAAQVAVLAADWTRLKTALSGARVPTLVRGLMPAEAASPAAPDPTAAAPPHVTPDMSRDRLVALAPEARGAALAAFVRTELSRLSEIPEARIDVHDSLANLGLDSITVLELKTRVEAALSVTVPTALLAEGPTIQQLVQYIETEGFAPSNRNAAAPQTAAEGSTQRAAARDAVNARDAIDAIHPVEPINGIETMNVPLRAGRAPA